jgi:hypothetical protein
MELYDLLHAIEKCPTMYLRQPTITELRARIGSTSRELSDRRLG